MEDYQRGKKGVKKPWQGLPYLLPHYLKFCQAPLYFYLYLLNSTYFTLSYFITTNLSTTSSVCEKKSNRHLIIIMIISPPIIKINAIMNNDEQLVCRITIDEFQDQTSLEYVEHSLKQKKPLPKNYDMVCRMNFTSALYGKNTIEPIRDGHMNSAYFEELCYIKNAKGETVGYCFIELLPGVCVKEGKGFNAADLFKRIEY